MTISELSPANLQTPGEVNAAANDADTLADWTIVLVSFNSARHLRELWARVPSALRERVVCVDNDSSDDTVVVARALFPVVVVAPNRGLSAGNNLGLDEVTTKYVLFCNPDVHPSIPDFAQLAAHLDENGGLVAPRLCSESGDPQDNARGVPVLARQVANRLVREGGNQRYRQPLPLGADGPVPWILGAAVAGTTAEVRALGGWPAEYFLYYEDTELCLRVWESGSPVWLLGTLEWTHRWERASRSLLSPAVKMHLRSAVRFFSSRPGLLLGSGRDGLSEHALHSASLLSRAGAPSAH